MGLCKCPHRKVTNIFCYEHRVNVCEYCLLKNHPKCVVDTYRNWITDSVFSSKCGLCDDELVSGDTVRLLCFHIVHWDCLDAWARALPDTTAPAGYNCPICKKMCLFPPKNQVSPIADELRLKMGQVNWARVGLGLPLLDNEVPAMKEARLGGVVENLNQDSIAVYQNSEIPDHRFEPTTKYNTTTQLESPPHLQHYGNQHQSYPNSSFPPTGTTGFNHNSQSPYGGGGIPKNQNHFYSDPPPLSTSATYMPRKTVKSEFEMETPLLMDEDDHKYRRRSPFESLSRWIKNSATVKSRRGRKRTALYVILAILATLLLLMFLFGRDRLEEEEGYHFNPAEANPNVKIGNGIGIQAAHNPDPEVNSS